MYENWKILKTELDEKQEEYSEVAQWCNQTQQYTIVCDGEYYKVEKIPEPTIDEKKNQVRSIRNRYLSETDIYMIVDFPISDEERELYKQYRQYLREYTNLESWWEQNPKTFEEWKEIIND